MADHARMAERSDFSSCSRPFDHRQVEMVGRLVEQEDVGLRARARGRAQRGGIRRPTVAGRVFLAGQAEFLDADSAAR